MNKFYILVIFLFLFFVCTKEANSQGELTLPMMQHVYQSSYYNPAAIPDHKFSLGLPVMSSIQLQIINSGFSLNNLIKNENGVNKFDISYLRNNVPNSSFINLGLNVDLFHLRVKWRNSYVFVDAGNHSELYVNYSKDMFQFFTADWTNDNEEGKKFDLSNVGGRFLNYNHIGFGIAKNFKKFDFGVRFKVLDGVVAGVVESNDAQIEFNKDLYDISLKNSITAYSSGFNSFTSSSNQAEKDRQNTIQKRFTNLGFGLDLAVTYKVTQKFKINLAINNLGFIDWKNDINNVKYAQDPSSGSFKGADVLGPILAGENISDVTISDTIQKFFQPKSDTSIKRSAFRTNLTPRLYLTLSYNITPRIVVAGTVKLEYYQVILPSYMLGAQFKLGRIFSLTASSSYQFENLNFGGGIMIKPGPFQFYFVSDNLFTPLYKMKGDNVNGLYLPLDARLLSARFGMNIVFGRTTSARKQPYRL